MEYFVPRQPDPFVQRARDQELAKFGHLNALVREINLLIPGAGITSIVAGANITVDNTDPQNPVISASGGGSQNLTQVLGVAPAGDAGGLPATNFSDISLNGSIYDEGGIGFGIQTAGALTLLIGVASTWTFSDDLTIIGSNIDMSGLTGAITAGAGGLVTGTITEQVSGAGVTIAGTGGNLLLMQDVVGQAFILIPASTADSACLNLNPISITPAAPAGGDIWFDQVNGGFSFQDAGNNPFTLLADPGWVIHTGVGSKAAYDADWTQTISAVVAQTEAQSIVAQVEAIGKTLASLQDHLMTNMDLLQA